MYENWFRKRIKKKKLKKLYNHINKIWVFDCSLEVFSYIGKGYYENQEFRNNINKFGEDVAEYISSSIKYYCNKIDKNILEKKIYNFLKKRLDK